MKKLNLSFPQFRSFVLACFGLCALVVTLSGLKTIPAKTDVTHPESASVWAAQLAAKSGRLYPALDRAPYTVAPYGPLFYLGLEAAARLSGVHLRYVRLGYRMFVFGCYLLLPVLVYLLLRRASFSRALAGLGALAAISSHFLPRWNATVRPDMPALLLSLLALWLVCRRDDPRVSDCVGAGLACAAALLFKASFVAAPLAIAVLLLLRRQYRHLLFFAGSGALAGIALTGYLMHRGEPVLRQMLLVSKAPIGVHTWIKVLNTHLPVGLSALVWPAACAGFLICMRSEEWRLRLYSYYFAFAALFGLASLLKAGGNVNYLIEMWVAAALLLPPVFMRLEEPWNRMLPEIKLAACLIVLFLLAQQLAAIRRTMERVESYDAARLSGLHVLSTDPYLTIHGRDPELLDPFLTTVLEQRHDWSPEPVLAEIARQDFDVVFLQETNHAPVVYREQNLFSPAILDGLRTNYSPLCRTSAMVVLQPRARNTSLTVQAASAVLGERCYASSDATF